MVGSKSLAGEGWVGAMDTLARAAFTEVAEAARLLAGVSKTVGSNLS